MGSGKSELFKCQSGLSWDVLQDKASVVEAEKSQPWKSRKNGDKQNELGQARQSCALYITQELGDSFASCRKVPFLV